MLQFSKVAIGGKDNVLEGLTEQIHLLHDAIASDAARPKSEDIEHAFENFHSSRVIRKMILDCPAFAATLWEKALEGKCKLYADGYRYLIFTPRYDFFQSHITLLCSSIM
jgi:pumilio family protein 6